MLCTIKPVSPLRQMKFCLKDTVKSAKIPRVEMKQFNEKMDIQEKFLYVNLYSELQKLKNSFKVTNAEICAGLKISRTPLDAFFSTIEEVLEKHKNENVAIEDIDFFARLDFNQVKIINLFRYLKDEDNIKKGRRNFEEIINKRKSLDQEVLNGILRAARCQEISHDSKNNIHVASSQRHPQVQRIISRFSSLNIPDSKLDHVFTNTLDIILMSLEKSQKEEEINPFDAEFAIENGLIKINQNISFEHTKKVENAYKKAVLHFTGNGKTKFSYEEIYELYFNVEEANLLSSIANEYRIRAENCQFKNLSNSHFQKSKDFLDPKIKKSLARLGFNEQILMSLQSPVTEAIVDFRFKNSQSVDNREIRGQWISISNHSPIDSTIKAVLFGLGCPLELKNLFVLNLGKGTGSCRRISITLIDQTSNKTFHGMWVDVSIVVGIAQATIAAIESWIKNEMALDTIPDVFHEIHTTSNLFSKLDRKIYKKLEHLNNYIIVANTNELIQEIRQEITTIDKSKEFKNLEKKLPQIYNEFNKFLNQKSSVLAWIELDFNKKKLDLIKMDSLFNEIERNRNGYIPTLILYKSEEINFKLICSDIEFLKRKKWRIASEFILENNTKKLIDYVNEQGLKDHYRMRDYFTSLSVSEIIGTISRLELYFCVNKEDIEFLQNAAENLILAAYFSSKIGLRQKAAGWLSSAARAYIRLGKEDEASDILKLAEIMIEPVIDVRIDLKYQYAIQSEIYLAKGELGIIKKEYEKSVELFTKALIGSLHIGYAILSADILFGLSRTCISKKLSIGELLTRQEGLELIKNLELINKSFESNTEDSELKEKTLDQVIAQEIITKLQKICTDKSLFEYENDFRSLSQYVWDKCCEKVHKEKHLISKMIEDKIFLKSLID
jgi:hypothetical protein